MTVLGHSRLEVLALWQFVLASRLLVPLQEVSDLFFTGGEICQCTANVEI